MRVKTFGGNPLLEGANATLTQVIEHTVRLALNSHAGVLLHDFYQRR